METRINIAEILRNKPHGIKLYSPIFGNCTFCYIKDEISDICVKRQYNVMSYFNFEGLYYTAGECLLFPSKEMRDWNKFAWKKGDVLTNSSGFQIFFDKWVNEDYTEFLGKIKLLGDSHCYDTAYYTLASEEEALEFIKSVEEINNGKLNRETLEIEKQTEFKDGDIVTMHKKNCDIVFIFNRLRTEDSFYYYAFHTLQTNNTGVIDCHITLPYAWTFFGGKMNFATDSEKQQLFDALAKGGKTWDAEKKQIVDLKPKYEFKPMDLCLMKYIGQYNNRGWELCQYAYTEHRVSSSGEQRDFYHSVGGEIYTECIPYNEDTKHLLGTRDKWKGGEQ